MHVGPHVRLRVSDTGMGMTPEVKGHAFEPFFTTKPQGKGTGLRLATVYGIVKQSGGAILLESEPERGATFDVYFPRTSEEIVPVLEAAPTSSRGSETILVVEDDPLVRKAAIRSLSAAGYRVIVAGSGREALEVAAREKHAFDLLLTDVIMPGQNGRELADELRRSRPDLRVLYMSGYAHE
jgi:two-component system, cell cycle sensor histidine kinase and response regulator CckA